mgnify:CR=1 FL=1
MNQIIAVNTLAYHGYELAEVFENISKSGAKYVEPVFIKTYYHELTEESFSLSNAKEIKNLINNAGLTVHAIAAHMDLGLENSSEMFLRRMDFGKEIGASIINTNATVKQLSLIHI